MQICPLGGRECKGKRVIVKKLFPGNHFPTCGQMPEDIGVSQGKIGKKSR
jgi:hypothetical protein